MVASSDGCRCYLQYRRAGGWGKSGTLQSFLCDTANWACGEITSCGNGQFNALPRMSSQKGPSITFETEFLEECPDLFKCS